MAAPWSTTSKTVAVRSSDVSPSVATAFVPPVIPSSQTFSAVSLFAAVARMQALRGAPASITGALVRAATSLTGAVVDNVGSKFELLPDAAWIELTPRRALSGSIGAGVCDLVMTSLNYVWRDHAQNVLTPAGPKNDLGDFVYDGGPASGHGLVLAEAKGALRITTTPSSIQTECESAYRAQVQPQVGKHCPLFVVHGYAIKIGARLASSHATTTPPHAFIHVAETALGSSPVAAFGTGISAQISMGGRGPQGAVGNAVRAVALGNYRAAFLLAGAPIVVAHIDALRYKRAPGSEEQTFDVIEGPHGEFLVGRPGPSYERDFGDFNRDGRRFAVHESVARAFLTELSVTGPQRDQQARTMALPILPTDFLGEGVFPDGFAYIKDALPSRTLCWSRRAGLG